MSPNRMESSMNTVRLGISGLEVSTIAFGTWQLGGEWGKFDEGEAIDAIRYAREQGINLFDTAQGYGFGASERLLGRALRDDLDHRRGEVVIATKGGLRIDDQQGLVRDSSPEWLREGAEQSLRALDIDYIDLYQVHWPDPSTPFAETAGALQELVDAGKIRHVGVSNFSVEQMAEFARTRPVETLQPPYAMFRREIEADVLPYTQEHDVGVLVYGPLAHGLLTGAMSPQTKFGKDDWRSLSPVFKGEDFEHHLGIVDQLQHFARERGHTISQLAIAWTLAHPAVQVAIVGSRRADHIEESIGALNVSLSEQDMAEIDEILAGAVPVVGPTPDAMP
jgi:aryl-alcohol dehydrogenase-like predicted oxidoreductase